MGKPTNNPDPNKNPYRVNKEQVREPSQARFTKPSVDFENQRVCPSCGKAIKISHNFCKFCGTDLVGIQPLGYSDRTLKELANTALTDPDPGVRKDAVDTLGELGDNEILGVLAYILLNDAHELVRKEAANELGDIHHPHSLDVLAKALKDRSPSVRKEAIEGLKKIKQMNKPEKIFDGLLVLQCQNGDKKSFSLLVKRWHHKLCKQAYFTQKILIFLKI